MYMETGKQNSFGNSVPAAAADNGYLDTNLNSAVMLVLGGNRRLCPCCEKLALRVQTFKFGGGLLSKAGFRLCAALQQVYMIPE